MIRIERDPSFWQGVAAHSQVAPHVSATADEIAALVAHQSVTPVATQNGGFIFRNLDGLGFVFELHTLYRPEGWGREVVKASHEAFAMLFNNGVACVVTHEQRDWWRSAPPKSHGWIIAADWRETDAGDLRMWVLTQSAWRASPSTRRRQCH